LLAAFAAEIPASKLAGEENGSELVHSKALRALSRFRVNWLRSITLAMDTRRLLTPFLSIMVAMPPALARRPTKITVTPPDTFLFGKGTTQRLVVALQYSDGSEEDVTTRAKFSCTKSAVATVDPSGLVQAAGNGVAKISVTYSGFQGFMTVLVQQAEAPRPVTFAGDVLPVLTKIGCNGGRCHGAFHGQNGFKLSLFGYDADADYDMITHRAAGRRVNVLEPEKSLILLKPSLQIPHGGGQVLPKDSLDYNTLLAWLRTGAQRKPGQEKKIVSIQVLPPSTMLYGKDSKRQLLVRATYSDRTEADVTRQVKFQSNDESLAAVSPDGVVSGLREGETAILVRAPGVAAAAKVGVVLENLPVPDIRPNNFVDEYVFVKLKSLHIPPSEPADEATFIRRAYLDIIGQIPTADETRRFLSDKNPGKRSKLVDDLLQRPEYADFWTVYWADHLLDSMELLYNNGPQNFTRWIYQAFRNNLPFDQFVRQLLTATGDMYDARRAASYYPLIKKPADMAAVTSQLFLGQRIECARCHNHPFEKWSRDDFRGMAAFFSQVRHKDSGPRGNEYILYLDFRGQYEDPDTKQVYWPKPLGAAVLPVNGDVDRRQLLADWMTSPQNPYFARTIVNRMWAAFMGQGLVEPVDDFRVTNPPTNEPLLDALARNFVAHSYDLHDLIRAITGSKAYQLSSRPNDGNREDKMAYSHYHARHLTAEQLLDSISQATGVSEQFASFYPGTRAAQLSYPETESYFLDVFDRSPRKEVCERTFRPTLNQVIHRVSGDTINNKVSAKGNVVGRLLSAKRPQPAIIEELYLRTLSRYPGASEQQLARNIIEKDGDVRRGLEDLLWALLNSKEFIYNH